MNDEIHVRGVIAEGHYGIGDEREEPQSFVVDVDLRTDHTPAIRSDSIDDTIDYAAVTREVRRVIEANSFDLIESLADAIADRLLAFGPDSVRVRVSKPRSAQLLQVSDIAVTVERSSG